MFLKYLLPFDAFVMNSPMAPDVVRDRLDAELHTDDWSLAPRGVAFIGRSEGDRFRIQAGRRRSPLFSPVVFGRIEAVASGSRVRLFARPTLLTCLFWSPFVAGIPLSIGWTVHEAATGSAAPGDIFATVFVSLIFMVVPVVAFRLSLARIRDTLDMVFRSFAA